MSYVTEARAALLANYPGEADERLIDLYTLLVLVKGESVTLEDVHDAWAVWTEPTRPDHRSLVPFDQLSTEVQELDEPYRAAIAAAAHQEEE